MKGLDACALALVVIASSGVASAQDDYDPKHTMGACPGKRVEPVLSTGKQSYSVQCLDCHLVYVPELVRDSVADPIEEARPKRVVHTSPTPWRNRRLEAEEDWDDWGEDEDVQVRSVGMTVLIEDPTRGSYSSSGSLRKRGSLRKELEAVSAAQKKALSPPFTLKKGKQLRDAVDRLHAAADQLIQTPDVKDALRSANNTWEDFTLEVHWYGKPYARQVESQIYRLYADPSTRKALDKLPPPAWYDLAVARRNAAGQVRRLGGAGSWAKNWMANSVTGDETTSCLNRSRDFARSETVVDPFTKQRSNLPYTDFSGKTRMRGDSKDWRINEITSQVGSFGEHHAVVLEYTGPRWDGTGNDRVRFVVDPWKAGRYLVSTHETWRARFPD